MSEEQGNCVGCGELESDEGFCHGCKAYICDNCMTNDVSGFDHSPEDHLLTSECCGANIFCGECGDCGKREGSL